MSDKIFDDHDFSVRTDYSDYWQVTISGSRGGCSQTDEAAYAYATRGKTEKFSSSTTLTEVDDLIRDRLCALSRALQLHNFVADRVAWRLRDLKAKDAYERWRASLSDDTSFDQLPPPLQQAWRESVL